MQVTSSTQVVIPNYLVILSHQCKLHHQLSWYYQITLLYFPTNASYIINSGGNTKLPCYTFPPMQFTSSTRVVIPNYLVILSHQCKLHHQLSWYYQITLLYFPTNASYINTKLPCYTLPPMQVTSSTWVVIPNYPVILSDWRSTTVSLETYPLYFLKSGPSQLINYMQEMLFLV